MVIQRQQRAERPPIAARRPAVAGAVTAAAGIVVQMAGGADYPVVPPGVLVLLAAAVLYAVPWRWAALPGALVAAFLSVGAVVTPNMGDQLGAPSEAGVFAGSVIELVGLVAALVCGIALAVLSIRRGRPA